MSTIGFKALHYIWSSDLS